MHTHTSSDRTGSSRRAWRGPAALAAFGLGLSGLVALGFVASGSGRMRDDPALCPAGASSAQTANGARAISCSEIHSALAAEPGDHGLREDAAVLLDAPDSDTPIP